MMDQNKIGYRRDDNCFPWIEDVPNAQRLMSKRARSTAVEVKGSHAVFVSQPQAVAALIETAARESAK